MKMITLFVYYAMLHTTRNFNLLAAVLCYWLAAMVLFSWPCSYAASSLAAIWANVAVGLIIFVNSEVN